MKATYNTENQSLEDQSIAKQKAPIILAFCIALLIILSDQLTKFAILKELETGDVIPIWQGFFNLTLTFNPGVAFGMLAGLDPSIRAVVLSLVTAIAFGVVIYLFFWGFRHDRLAQLALALIFGGAVGNIVDRLVHGAVVDFLDFYYGSYHWPAFNIADSAICVGVVFLLFRNPVPPTSETITESTSD